MVRYLTFRKRRPGLERPAFFDWWRAEHCPRLRALPGITRYVASLAATEDDGILDGVDELWFASRAQAEEALAGGAALDAERAAAAQTVLTARIGVIERQFVDLGRGPRFKLLAALKRRSDLDRAAFARWWLERHAPLVVEFPSLSRYRVSLVESAETAEGFADGVADVSFDDLETLKRVMFSTQVREVQGDSEVHSVARYRLIAEEHLIV